MQRFFQIFDRFFLHLERKWGLNLVSFLCGILLLLFAFLWTSSRWELFYHGKGFSNLSLAPFDFSVESGLRFRILSPLLGYLLFLKGAAFKYLMLFFLFLFLALLYGFHRKKGFSAAAAFGLSGLLALSTLSFFQLYFPGYTDPVSYVLILLILFNKDKLQIVSICLALLLFNHENTAFLFPFLFLFLLPEELNRRTFLRTVYCFLPAVILYMGYRTLIASMTPVDFNTSYYFDKTNLHWTWDHVSDHLEEGIFQAFRAGWLLPLIALYINMKAKRFREIMMIIVGSGFVLLQFVFAYDISRLTGLAFPVLLISAWRIHDTITKENFVKLVWALLLLNLFIPSYCIGALEPIPLPPFWWHIFFH